ncbi:MlaD family protein [Marinilongibacter aquaticus]|uniref:MlaD family protein n=1 Tax=Marinilongibacter aquaticus TaxID=2975157 RepID=UPI0021BDAD39|nr:MlaD family protein [Marinilongibacter aquaticus]UBM58060.1 MlaD family protein [Marinilongibacter aquaticus]
MKISKEAKVGLLGIVAIAVFYLGFNFLKGLDLFSTENEYMVVFDDVQGLQTSNQVSYKGVTVGRVLKITPDQENEQIRVTLAVRKKIVLTDRTVALLADDGLIGGKLIKLDIQPGKEIGEGTSLIGETQLGLADSAIEQITPALHNVDSLVINLNKIVSQFDQTGYALNALLESAKQTSNGVNAVLANNQSKLAEITTNAALLTANLNQLTSKLDSQMAPIMAETGQFTKQLNTLELEETVSSLNETVNGLKVVLDNVNQGQGTLGKLTSDDSLYTNLDRTAASLEALLSDMKANPRRYVHFSLFGGKDKSEKKKEKQ